MAVAGCAALIAISAAQLRLVQQEVPQPYLDEVFHIPQAQEYCAGHWTVWDSKITTPPGLYLIAAFFRPVLGCSTTSLRVENALCLLATAFVVYLILLQTHESPTNSKQAWTLAHSSGNIVLFPVLFFFSVLYYTDVPSTLSVLVFQYARLQIPASSYWLQNITLLALGLISLSFRQTNIFWIAIYPAAVTLVEVIDCGQDVVRTSLHNRAPGMGDSVSNIVKTSWRMKVVYNPTVARADLADYWTCVASIVACLAANLRNGQQFSKVLRAMAPYIMLLISFALFVIWNGSVVLGDKSNHVATLHLPQMLYIWPYIVFFSWPVVYQYILAVALSILPAAIGAPLRSRLATSKLKPSLSYMAVFVGAGAIAVRYNTIVHPFTLADNRHYTFYVFRLLMRPWWIKYAVLPVYAVCAWICVQALRQGGQLDGAVSRKESNEVDTPAIRLSDESRSKATFVMIWIATTALQVITAPLVEPRYFILPWMFWRMALLRANPVETVKMDDSRPKAKKPLSAPRSHAQTYDYSLWVETAWLLLVDAVTSYIFLNWRFTWASEPGSWQRFMW